MERRDTVDSLMMDGDAMERIASVEPAMMGGGGKSTPAEIGKLLEGRELEEGMERDTRYSNVVIMK